MTQISRRSMIAGLTAGAAVSIIPAAIADPIVGEDPASRVHRLAEELSDALDHFCKGKFRAVVEPASKAGSGIWLQNMGVGPGRGHV